MSPRNLLNLPRSKTGKLLLFALIFAAALLLLGDFQRKEVESIEPLPPGPTNIDLPSQTSEVVQTVSLPMEAFHPPTPKPEPPPPPPPPVQAKPQPIHDSPPPQPPPPALVPTPISLFADAPKPKPKTISTTYAPYGRLIPCETIITVDSAKIQTPIIGLITENIYHAGRLVIPAGTEVHGTAQADRTRDRLASGGAWVLVWQTGEELRVRGIALDREFSGDQTGWAITDGSAGLRGEIIKSDNLAEIKLFAATFLSGAAAALTEQQATLLGPLPSPTLNNAPLLGAQAVLQTYAQRIYETIQRDGFYIRVPAGKQFYLYILQTIDRADARIGGGEIPFTQTNSQEDAVAKLQSKLGTRPPAVPPAAPGAIAPQAPPQP